MEPVVSPFLWGPLEHIQQSRWLSYPETENDIVKPFAGFRMSANIATLSGDLGGYCALVG